MVDITVRNLMWSPAYGRPLVVLESHDGEWSRSIPISADEARALSAGAAQSVGQARAYALFEVTLALLGARLRDVVLHSRSDGALRAHVHIDGPQRTLTLPVTPTDGIILAHRNQLPVRLAGPIEAQRSIHDTAPGDQPEERGPDPLAAFRGFVESLDL